MILAIRLIHEGTTLAPPLKRLVSVIDLAMPNMLALIFVLAPLSLLTAAPKLDALPGARPPLVEIPAIMTAPRPPFGAKSARLEPALRNSVVPVSNVGELENDE